ncbi:MAG: tetratricopeptide repeat protein [Pyrinomonadaceae bacterium]|nr:tetratricopeptide repeat protein [Pyrinomonadaceae bacterium]
MQRKTIPLAILLVILIVSLASGQSRPTNQAEYIKRGNAKYSKAEYLDAMREYQRVTPEAGEVYSQALFNIGVCYYELWRTEDAVAMYQKALVARAGHYPKAFYALGVALEELERQDEAKEAYKQAVAASPSRETGAANFRLGLLLAGEGDYERAAAHFTEAINRETSAAGHNNLGVVLALGGRLHEAEKEFEAALKQAGGVFADATNNLKLCRSLLKASAAKDQLTSFKLVAATRTPGS